MLDYRLSIKTSLDEVVTPQTDYRLSIYDFNEILLKSKDKFKKTLHKKIMLTSICLFMLKQRPAEIRHNLRRLCGD